MPLFHEEIIATGFADQYGDEMFRCPLFGFVDALEAYDCLGADEDCVFCNGCQAELQT